MEILVTPYLGIFDIQLVLKFQKQAGTTKNKLYKSHVNYNEYLNEVVILVFNSLDCPIRWLKQAAIIILFFFML